MPEAWCPVCQKKKSYIITWELLHEKVGSQIVTYIGQQARCATCLQPVYVETVQEYNLMKIEESLL